MVQDRSKANRRFFVFSHETRCPALICPESSVTLRRGSSDAGLAPDDMELAPRYRSRWRRLWLRQARIFPLFLGRMLGSKAKSPLRRGCACTAISKAK